MVQRAHSVIENGKPYIFEGLPELYGQLTITGNSTVINRPAPADPNLNNNADYVAVTGIWGAIPHGVNRGIIQQPDSLLIPRPCVCEVAVWMSVTSDQNLTNVALKFSVNDAISLGRRPRGKVGVANDRLNLSAHGFVSLPANAFVKLVVAADKACNLLIEDCVFSLVEI